MYTQNVHSCARMLHQILDTSNLSKNFVNQAKSVEMTSVEGGPKHIVKDVVEMMTQVQAEKSICIKLNDMIRDADEVMYCWRVYKSIFFHYILWSINNSETDRYVFVDLSI